MFKTLLVPLFGQGGDKETLEIAYKLLIDQGHMNCLYIHDDAAAVAACIQTDAMGAPVATVELIDKINKECAAQKVDARRIFDHFCKAHDLTEALPDTQVARSASWSDVNADIVEGISHAAHYNDIVFLRHGAGFAEPTPQSIGRIAIGAGRPVLVFPESWQARPIRRVAIAWKDTPEAARAVSSAMPILNNAERVFIFSAAENEQLRKVQEFGGACATFLNWHGINAETCNVEANEEAAMERLFDCAEAEGTDLVIMGAYGHSRMREFAFGGFTRAALQERALPLMLMH
jgi:nucleotide-binding universal stress UspA family protein